MDDAAEYAATNRAAQQLGFSPDEVDGMFDVVGALLHLGNAKFVAEATEFADDSAKLVETAGVDFAAYLLGVVDYGWFILLAMVTIFLPDAEPLYADYELVALPKIDEPSALRELSKLHALEVRDQGSHTATPPTASSAQRPVPTDGLARCAS